jgi:hypothetical protein
LDRGIYATAPQEGVTLAVVVHHTAFSPELGEDQPPDGFLQSNLPHAAAASTVLSRPLPPSLAACSSGDIPLVRPSTSGSPTPSIAPSIYIEMTSVPARGALDTLSGCVHGLPNPASYVVCNGRSR